MVIDHIGVVVRSLEDGIARWKDSFAYVQNSPIVTNTRQKVRVVFLAKRDSVTVKLVEPSDPSSPVALFARRGGGLHHVCFRCADMSAEIPPLQKKGARLVVAPEPGEAFKSRNIAFLFGQDNLNIELIDTTEKEGWLGLA